MTLLYPNLCYNDMWYNVTVLYLLHFTIVFSVAEQLPPMCTDYLVNSTTQMTMICDSWSDHSILIYVPK